ncbi:MAG: glycosyltransferase [Anaerolineales bacterium]|jgi:glycosyltransferase involved in cell wall biosynthesis/predicted  nucleic acid-binding Zn-ribbon protein
MAEPFDEHYFRHGCGRPYERTPEWLEGFARIADHIVEEIRPSTVLDAGCAMGFLVEALRDRGVEAYGVDISEYAIRQVQPGIRDYCQVGSITDPFPRTYDLIVCIETLEHLPAAQASQAVSNLCRHTGDVLFTSTPFDYREATHFNVNPPEYWAELFARAGFLHDLDYDATYLAPWAMRLRRSRDPLSRVIAPFERTLWRLRQETGAQREVVLQQRHELSELEAQASRREQALAQSQSQLEELRESLAVRESQAGELTSRVRELESEGRQLREKISELEGLRLEAESAKARMRARLAELESEGPRLREKISELESEGRQLKEKVSELEGLRLESEADTIRLQARAAELQDHLLRVYGSKSMRLTAPLRHALMWLRGAPPPASPPQPASGSGRTGSGALDLARQGARVWRREGFPALWRKGTHLIATSLHRGRASGSSASAPAVPSESPSGFGEEGDWRRVRPHIFPTPRSFRVLFFNGQGNREGDWSQSPRYRVHNVREGLALAGISTSLLTVSDLPADAHVVAEHDLLVLFRAGWSPELQLLVETARHFNVPVVYDVDDYVFEPDLATPRFISGIENWTPEQQREYAEGVKLFRRALELCDYFTGSTGYLQQRAQELGIPGAVLRNGPGQTLLKLSQEAQAAGARTSRPGHATILYMSGTTTHQRDFAQAASSLAEVLQAREGARLLTVGHLDLSGCEELAPFRGRIEQIGFVDWRELPALIARADINIAPLELGNPFCEAKSELKYFEAALVGVPTVASATDGYSHAIQDGVTGYVCSSRDCWRERLLALVDDMDLRLRLGQSAREHVREAYDPTAMGREAGDIYRGFLRSYRERKGMSAQQLEVGWVATAPAPGSGGHHAVLRAANEMSRQGHHVVLYLGGDSRRSGQEWKDFIQRQFGLEPAFEIVDGTDAIMSHDVLIATHYSTAHLVEANKDRAYLRAYFVQDFEPYFFPLGADYFEAERTYRYDFYCITVGRWLEERLRTEYGREAESIPFWVDREAYFPPKAGPAQKGPVKVAFLARPDMPRRCYSLGVRALRLFKRTHPQSTIAMFGAQSLPREEIDFEFQDLGVLSRRQLGELYRSADIGLAFSTTNPSLVPMEMMACGLPVVDIDVMGRSRRHEESAATLAEPSPESIAQALSFLAENPTRRAELAQAALECTNRLPSPDEALGRVGELIEKRMHRGWEQEIGSTAN